ncbi:MAG: 7-carboxy-7-deazaguanine synthase QueE [Gammaproteobacteria bacterium]|nr:7-carboxy-7-deazaguanine synthase QueE [Gammaproteobacteria bacterium]
MQGQAAATSSAPIAVAARLKVTETFYSLQGEADAVGWPTFFIRLTGCPLRCQYCDTAYAFEGGEWRSLEVIVEEALASGARHVCVTGGEPLAQKGCLALLVRLCDAGLQVSLETSGAIDASAVDPRVVRVIDIKTPGSGESQRNLDLDTQGLRSSDLLKFVICDRGDYEWSRELVRSQRLDTRCQVLLSPSYLQLPAAQLADWILADRLPVRFQVQLHKVLWGDAPGR